MEFNHQLKEVYRTDSACVYQCDRNYCFWVEFGGINTSFNVPCYFALKKKIDSINLDAMALNPDKAFDIEIIHPCGSDRMYILSLPQAIEFKELLAGAKVMLELNSIIRDRLKTVVVE